MEAVVANPHGFCAGVDRAIAVVGEVLRAFDEPIYVKHEVVHNQFVVESLKKEGAIFIEELEDVPDGSIVVFSAHGVARSVWEEAQARRLEVFDATCPLVVKVHIEVARYSRQGIDTILVGHRGHPEVDGTMGQYDSVAAGHIYLVESVEDAQQIVISQPDNVAYVTQTTLSMDDTQDIITVLEQRFPKIQAPHKEDICYATQNRQNAVKQLVDICDLVLVIGSSSSSNSNRLYEIPAKHGIESYLIDNADEIDAQWLQGKKCIGVSAGASAPEVLVEGVIARLKELGVSTVRQLGNAHENVSFPLPSKIRELKVTGPAEST